MAELIAAKVIFIKRFNDPLSIMNRLFCGWHVRDRFCILNKYAKLRTYNVLGEDEKRILAGETTPLHFPEIMDKRAKEIIALNKPVMVSWSGGVDSTGVICALLKNGLPKERLTVLHATSSIEEYPWFYQRMKEQGIKCIEQNKVARHYKETTDELIITGWCADQLFGSNIHLRNLDLYNLPWTDGLRKALEDRRIFLSDKGFDKLVDIWGDYGVQLGFDVQKFCQFAWLYNFGIKWSHVSKVAYFYAGKKARDRVINFYEDIDFQFWSIRKYDHLADRNVNRYARFYKRSLKIYIHEYLNDPDYLNFKGKTNSWAMTDDWLESIDVLDTEGWHAFVLPTENEGNDIRGLNDILIKKYSW